MKYIKLFEAFNSSKISKTLSFINKDSKSKFLNLLKQISTIIDFPISKLSDEYFQYLPFNKALELNFSYVDDVCTATSKDSYPDYYVPGSSCDKGHVDRKWGKGIRSAICTICSGTGIKPKKEPEIKWIKFWFDKDGNFISSTLTDGKIRAQRNYDTSSGTSFNLSEYEVVKDLTLSELLELEVGTPVYINLSGIDTVGIIWKGKYGSDSNFTFIIQNVQSGNSDESSKDWMKFGDKSWVIVTSRDFNGTPKLLKPNNKKEEIEVPNPYTWNTPFDINRYGGGFSISTSSSVDHVLSKAHFAIVMNFLDLKKSEFKKTSVINSEREKNKSGAFISNDEIRNTNIQKYISTLVKNAKLPTEIENINSTIIRFMGGSYTGFYILNGRNNSDFSQFILYLYRIFTDDSKESSYENALEYLKNTIRSNSEFNSKVSKSIGEIKTMIRDNKTTQYLPIIDSIIDLNTTINDKFKSFKFETIEDLEIVIEKIRSIRSVWRESSRLRIRDIVPIVEYIHYPSRLYSYMENVDDINLCLEKMKIFKKFIDRL